MQYRITKVQNSAADCFVCGVENESGLKARFYELEDGSLGALVTFQPIHQSYPGRVHGGAITALLDEAIGRAVQIPEPESWGVTGDLEIKFKQPVPYGVPLRLHCRLTQNKRLLFSGEGRLYLPDDTLAAVATARYRKLALSQIAEFSPDGRDWSPHPREDDPETLDLPLWA